MFENLISFKRSQDGMLRTIGARKTNKVLEDGNWHPIKGDEQFEPYLLAKNGQLQEYICEN